MRTFGRYRILREAAAGGMAVVYEADDPSLSRRVAIKTPRWGSDDPMAEARLRREAALGARIRHPGVAAVHEYGTLPSPYIAMEFVDGAPLSSAMPRLSLSRKLKILERLAEAVAYVNGRGIVHRDLKPDNVLIGTDGLPKIVDFGLACLTSHPQDPGEMAGTLRYMSPEQVDARRGPVGPWTDVWALGVILYEMLTGTPPFGRGSVTELCSRILAEAPIPPRCFDDAIPPAIESLCLRALSKEPRQRPSSAEEIAYSGMRASLSSSSGRRLQSAGARALARR